MLLYHYTTVDTLALILKTRTIKFNALTELDDADEQYSNMGKAIGRCVFISAWTDKSTDSIPMWKMYAPIEKGVRIAMPNNMFSDVETITKETGDDAVRLLHSQIDRKWTPEKKYTFLPRLYQYKVDYSNASNAIYPPVYEHNGEGYDFHLERMGVVKSKYWKFQNEYRYRIFALPSTLDEIRSLNLKQLGLTYFMPDPLPFRCCFLPLSDDAFSLMRVVLSPQISEGNRVIVDALRAVFNPKMRVSDSILTGKLK